jgi:RNA polymerase sigma-32 factor
MDDRDSQEATLVASEEMDNRHAALSDALELRNDRERRIFEARRLADKPAATRRRDAAIPDPT